MSADDGIIQDGTSMAVETITSQFMCHDPGMFGDCRVQELYDTCSLDWLRSLPEHAQALLKTSHIDEFVTRYPEHKDRLRSEIRAMVWTFMIVSNCNEEAGWKRN